MARHCPLLIALFFLTCATAPDDDKPVTLDELVKEYERFELPFPPAGTKCVIVEAGYDNDKPDEDGTYHIVRKFALLAKPKTKLNTEARIFYGIGTYNEPVLYRIREVPAEPESLRLITKEIFHLDIITAIQCQKLGYKQLANDLFRRWKPHENEPPREHLWHEPSTYWLDQILNPKRDRKTIIRQLKNVNQVIPSDEIAEFIRCLELADVQRTVKNNPIERLIDDLVDASNVISEDDVRPYQECLQIRKLIECGFDSVPLLIAHLEDKRLTRCSNTSGYGYSFPNVTVGNVCEYILQEMAGKLFPRVELTAEEKAERDKENLFPLGGLPFGKKKPLQCGQVNEWWNQARAKGEKEYLEAQLFTRVMPGGSVADDGPQKVNWTILMMLSARFPSELKEVYRKSLNSETPKDTSQIAESLVKSNLDKRTKREILEFGLTHREFRHRLAAEMSLATLDN